MSRSRLSYMNICDSMSILQGTKFRMCWRREQNRTPQRPRISTMARVGWRLATTRLAGLGGIVFVGIVQLFHWYTRWDITRMS